MDKIKSDYLNYVKELQISDAVYTALKENIIQNQLDPAFRIKEEELASILNISRTPIREALRSLQRNDYIIADTQKGYIVKRLSVNESIDIIEYVHFLRRFAAEITASQITRPELLLLNRKKLTETQLGSISDPAKASDIYKCHQEFHLSIAKLTNNSFLHMESMRMHEKLLIIHYYYTGPMKSDFPGYSFLEEHEKLLEAFRNHDGKQAREIVDHYSRNMYLVIKRMYKIKMDFDYVN